MSLVIKDRGADALGECGRPPLEGRKGKPGEDPAGSETSCMLRNNSRGNREIPCLSGVTELSSHKAKMVISERIGASKDISQ